MTNAECVVAMAKRLTVLSNEITSLKAELACAQAFHAAAVAERNLAWAQIEGMKREEKISCALSEMRGFGRASRDTLS